MHLGLGPNLRGTLSWAPRPQPLPRSLNCTLAWPEGASLPSHVLSWPWGAAQPPQGLVGVSQGCVDTESLSREQAGDHEQGLGLTSTHPSTAVQGDSENQVLVLVERRR